MHRLSGEFLPYAPLFGRALIETGVGNEDFVTLSQRIGTSTGGIRATRFSSATADRRGATSWLVLRSKTLPNQTNELMAILRDILTGARLDNRGRFQQLVLGEKASLESNLVPAGRASSISACVPGTANPAGPTM